MLPYITDQHSHPRAITFLLETQGKRMCKLFTPEETCPYGNGMFFRACSVLPPDIEGLKAVLEEAQRYPSLCAIRGVKKPAAPEVSRRTKNDHDECPAAFEDIPRAWVCLDLDAPTPDGAPDLVHDTDNAVEFALQFAPREMQDASFVWQLGNSAGMKRKYSMHLWAMLDKPVSSTALREYMHQTGFDPALSDCIQVHYTARPIFDGLDDPVQNRIGIRYGEWDIMRSEKILSQGSRRKVVAKAMAPPPRESTFKGEKTTTADILRGPLKDRITKQAARGWYYCDCPCHQSTGKTSLHVNAISGQWRCNGCDISGGTAWALADFLSKGLNKTTVQILQEADRCRS
jgi:hypothetical protein